MKKFLTVLLALSVVFTYSFGTVFAATDYSLDDYATALNAEKTAQLGYLASAKTQAVNSYTYNEDGFTTISSTKYMKAAIEAAAAAVIADLTSGMDTVINDVLNGTFPTTTAPDKSVVSDVTTKTGAEKKVDATTAAGMKALLEAKTDDLNKAQAPLTKAFVQSKLNVDYSKYNSTDKKYAEDGKPGTVLTAAQYMTKLVADATAAIATADNTATDALKIKGYTDAYAAFTTAAEKVKTLADEGFDADINAGTVDKALSDYEALATATVINALGISPNMAADATLDWASLVAEAGSLKAFWEADKTTAGKGTFFGVAVANIAKVTRTEAVAVQKAAVAAIAASKAPIKVYANGDAAKVSAIDDATKALKILKNAMDVADKYADVVKAGDKLKGTYLYGTKRYDDAKVDKAVKDAEALVYADLGTTLKTDALDYIIAATEGKSINDLELANFELQKFEKAVETAAKKMYSDGASTPALKITYGDDKTADADLVYLKGTYDTTEAGADWEKIATQAISDLKDAQSYADIDKVMAKAAEDFGKLLKADDAAKVKEARTSYATALDNYGTLKFGLVDQTKYPMATITAAVNQGKKLINDAVTVDAVKAAYEQGKALVDGIKTVDELKNAKEAIEKQITALPYTAKLTLSDKATVKAAYDSYVEYKKLAGADEISNKAQLKEKYDKIIELEAADIEAQAKTLVDQLKTINTGSDADVVARLALKADINKILDAGKALLDEVKAVNEDAAIALNVVSLGTNYESLKDYADDIFDDELYNVQVLFAKAMKDGATVADMQAALDAYNALTDYQKYTVDASILQFKTILESKLGSLVESLKVTASSKAYKGKIKVSWKVSGTTVDGVKYQVYRSTKKSSGYVKKWTTSKKTYSNTAVKKGTRYYYKVRAIYTVGDKTYYSDWSNKAYRVAK